MIPRHFQIRALWPGEQKGGEGIQVQRKRPKNQGGRDGVGEGHSRLSERVSDALTATPPFTPDGLIERKMMRDAAMSSTPLLPLSFPFPYRAEI